MHFHRSSHRDVLHDCEHIAVAIQSENPVRLPNQNRTSRSVVNFYTFTLRPKHFQLVLRISCTNDFYKGLDYLNPPSARCEKVNGLESVCSVKFKGLYVFIFQHNPRPNRKKFVTWRFVDSRYTCIKQMPRYISHYLQ